MTDMRVERGTGRVVRWLGLLTVVMMVAAACSESEPMGVPAHATPVMDPAVLASLSVAAADARERLVAPLESGSPTAAVLSEALGELTVALDAGDVDAARAALGAARAVLAPLAGMAAESAPDLEAVALALSLAATELSGD